MPRPHFLFGHSSYFYLVFIFSKGGSKLPIVALILSEREYLKEKECR